MSDHTSKRTRQRDSHHDARVFIAGDDVAGLSAGLALHERGYSTTVFGRTPATGVDTIHPYRTQTAVRGVVIDSAIRRFLSTHVGGDSDSPTTHATEYRYLDVDGTIEASFGADLELSADDVLRGRLRDAFPSNCQRPAQRIERWDRRTSDRTSGNEVRVIDSAGERHHGALLVAADGWLSDIRQRVHPSVTPAYAGYVSWQGTIHEADVPRDLTNQFANALSVSRGDRDLLAGMVLPGPDGSSQPGDRRLHWVWYTPVADRELGSVLTDKAGNNRNEAVPPGLLQDRYATELRERAATHAPQFTRLVRATPDPGVEPVVDVTVPRAVVARTVLIGDAAYTSRHHMAASTPKAIADASTLAAALDRYDDVDVALDDWSTTQELRGRQLVEAGRQSDLDRLVGSV